jgi:ribonuclease D
MQYISKHQQLVAFAAQHQQISWLAFDTEFVGENTYVPQLSLIQVASEFGIFIIDPISIEDLRPFLQLIENAAILKITHAGDNDYKLLFSNFGTVPKNIFDTQYAIGFCGIEYQPSLQSLAQQQLGKQVAKGYGQTDWNLRPLTDQQLDYAAQDVEHLHALYVKINEQLHSLNRAHILQEELRKYEQADFYEEQKGKEILVHEGMFNKLRKNEQILLLRLLQWRLAEAKRRNVPKDMVLGTKSFGNIVKGIKQGKNALLQNRHLKPQTVERYWTKFHEMYTAEPLQEELEILANLPKYKEEPPEHALAFDFLHLTIRQKCLEQKIAHEAVYSKTTLRNHLNKNERTPVEGWRTEILGTEICNWINAMPCSLHLSFSDNNFTVSRITI